MKSKKSGHNHHIRQLLAGVFLFCSLGAGIVRSTTASASNPYGLNSSYSTVWSSLDENTSGLAWGDIDNDGDLDLVAANMMQPSKYYRNDNGTLTRGCRAPSGSVDWNVNHLDH